MKVTLFQDGTYASNSYLVTDDAETGAVLIDPSVSPALADRIAAPLPRIDAILLTHGHFDHMLALDAWRQRTGAPLLMSAEDAPALGSPVLSCYRSFLGENTTHAPADGILAAGDIVKVGEESLIVIALPGHTPGCLAFDSGELLFSGDTMFAGGGYGRFDLPGGDGELLARSLTALLELQGERRLLAGHGEEGLLSAERNYYNFS